MQLADEVKHAFGKHAEDDITIKAQAESTAALQSDLQRAEQEQSDLTQKLQDLNNQMQIQTDVLQTASDELANIKQQLEQVSLAKVLLQDLLDDAAIFRLPPAAHHMIYNMAAGSHRGEGCYACKAA